MCQELFQMLRIQHSIGETTTSLDYEGVIRGHSPNFGTTDELGTPWKQFPIVSVKEVVFPIVMCPLWASSCQSSARISCSRCCNCISVHCKKIILCLIPFLLLSPCFRYIPKRPKHIPHANIYLRV